MNQVKDLFTTIYKNNSWQSPESVSGKGSELNTTIYLREQLPELFKKYSIGRILDVGCGDFNWMKEVVPHVGFYLGIDVVTDLIDKNNELYKTYNIIFKEGDIQDIDLSEYDFDAVFFCDVLVHLPYANIKEILSKVSKHIKYVFMTHFTEFTHGGDINISEWRPINFTLEPFNMPPPLESIPYNEPYEIGYGLSNDKTLSLWQLK